ncbi:hypothetical protein OJF2_33080 [Aquisphaera giovannonii]|uniref:3-keto-alpha-glucoside-1,2-lyase/3-keto-2-hydroxy-glucal hydratase domain-containing protein n=1 Tax=Aquisphaera giovannonii TaxID=406548 RepID=A0A5B9W2G8_9BACT|nr:DUF1080 domain-containing protein [Aquisphaera giovannonii]QEH34766.1 hypothetical protein OJF2_33080 [Aquisphaera giovannonii]
MSGSCRTVPWGLIVATAMAAAALAPPAVPGGAVGDDKASAAGRRALFDGKSLDGWKKADFFGAGVVEVRDGTIVLGTGQSMTGITTTRGDLPKVDYELSYEAMKLSGQDFFAAATFPVGDAFITFVNGGWGGNVTGLSSLDGQDASENETTRSFRYAEKTWYKFRVRVTGTTIRAWIDDKEMAAVRYKDRRVSTRIETRRNQPLGFASYETAGAIRNIEVRPLTPAEVAGTEKPEDE